LVLVGGPAKMGSLGGMGSTLQRLALIAAKRGVRALAAFEEGTPEAGLDVARRQLGADRGLTFPQ